MPLKHDVLSCLLRADWVSTSCIFIHWLDITSGQAMNIHSFLLCDLQADFWLFEPMSVDYRSKHSLCPFSNWWPRCHMEEMANGVQIALKFFGWYFQLLIEKSIASFKANLPWIIYNSRYLNGLLIRSIWSSSETDCLLKRDLCDAASSFHSIDPGCNLCSC